MNIGNEDTKVYLIILVTNSISALSCMFIITIFILAKSLRVYAFKLVLYLSLLDLAKSLSMIIPTFLEDSEDLWCRFQSIAYQCFTIMSFLIALLMAVSLYLCVVSNTENVDKRKLQNLALFLMITGGLTLPQVFLDAYGRANSWCWIKKKYFLFRMTSFYGPLWVVNIINLLVYWKVIKSFRKNQAPLGRLIFYPFILIICYIPGTICRVVEEVTGESYDYLIYAMVAGDGLCGFVNSVLYGFTDHVKLYINDCLCFKKRQQNSELLDLTSFTI